MVVFLLTLQRHIFIITRISFLAESIQLCLLEDHFSVFGNFISCFAEFFILLSGRFKITDHFLLLCYRKRYS